MCAKCLSDKPEKIAFDSLTWLSCNTSLKMTTLNPISLSLLGSLCLKTYVLQHMLVAHALSIVNHLYLIPKTRPYRLLCERQLESTFCENNSVKNIFQKKLSIVISVNILWRGEKLIGKWWVCIDLLRIWNKFLFKVENTNLPCNSAENLPAARRPLRMSQ